MKEPSSSVHPNLQQHKHLWGAEEMMRKIAEAEQLEGVGRSPPLLLTQQLVQMAAEVGPSMSGG